MGMPFPHKQSSSADGIQVWDGQGQEPLSVQQRKWRRQNKLASWPKGNWRWVAKFQNERGQQVRFCYSLHRNEAGYFLAWREVRLARGAKPTANPLFTIDSVENGHPWTLLRYDVVGRRQKHRAKAFAEKRAEAWPKRIEQQRAAKAAFTKREQEREARRQQSQLEATRMAQDLVGRGWPGKLKPATKRRKRS